MSVQAPEGRAPADEKVRQEPEPAKQTDSGGAIQRISATEQLKATRAKAQEDALAFISQCGELDWKRLPPYITAQLLVKVPRKGRKDEIWFMSLEHALVYAIRCYELELSPFSSDVYPRQDDWGVNIATSGKRERARKQGLNLSPPHFTRLVRPWKNAREALFGLPEDVGYTCEMTVNGDEKHPVTYTAFLSEWAMPFSQQWRERPEHMLQVRSMEKAISFASGTGVSDLPDEKDIEGEVEIVKPEIVVKG